MISHHFFHFSPLFSGDFYHGCLKCYAPDAPLIGGELAHTLYAQTMERMRLLSAVTTVKYLWECQIKEFLSMERFKNMALFFTITEVSLSPSSG